MPAKSSSSSKMKQATLSFGSSKRTTAQGVKPKDTQAKKPPVRRKAPSRVSSEDEVDLEDVHVPSSDEESADEKPTAKPTARPEERPTISSKTSKTRKVEKQVNEVPVNPPQPQNSAEHPEVGLLPELNENDPKWRKQHAAAREKMGHMHPIHANGQTKIHEILRVFDLSYEYGPFVGISRLERWERAAALGLNPPVEVKDILTTRQGMEQLSQSVLHGEV
ncbi:putative DNA polymerase delta, subunit 4 [Lyophyllum shimeji]|uniref:DNA polymerase delta, subunit 4 n=1 Tax=Lyophyllum shimeji TaxID=47721 RepID=A0A9P3UQV3_LYOSH|nr:putative DNA polymerase delta, subunit 4 [Lyophyllum shimeji]